MNEAELSKRIVRALKKKGAFASKIHGGQFQTGGLPDIVGCHKGRFFGLEVKMPGKEDKVTPRQAKKLADIKAAGGIAGVVTNLQEVHELVFGDGDSG